MNIVVLDPYFCASHAAWAQGYAENSRHNIETLQLRGSFWKWRMHGGAVTLARKFLAGGYKPDLIIASDMLDLGNFLALTRQKTSGIPCAVYFHENQLSYPWSPEDRDPARKRDYHYGFINYLSALAADAVFFNSEYHQKSFLTHLNELLRRFPDNNEVENVSRIKAKSRVLPLGIDLRRLDKYKPERVLDSKPPRILWNHRWEYDKNPEEFFKAINDLDRTGLSFEIVVLGQCFKRRPGIFTEAEKKFKKRTLQFGYEKKFSRYAEWLWSSDILPVTSRQEFFGISVMEAIYCGCTPLLPKRLAYPELIPSQFHENFFYKDYLDLVSRLKRLLRNIPRSGEVGLQNIARKYDWEFMAPVYDRMFEKMAGKSGSGKTRQSVKLS